jgi:hypothetical protein
MRSTPQPTTRSGPLRPLREVLTYRHQQVLEKFVERYDVTPREARALFVEMLRWLWLAAACRRDAQAGRHGLPRLAIDAPLLMLDEMWHTFLLFTVDYAAFCRRYLGAFVHHVPTSAAHRRARRTRAQRDPAAALREERRRLTRQYGYVYERLGTRALRRWYEELPRRFPASRLVGIVRPPRAA